MELTSCASCGKATTPYYPSYKGRKPGLRRCQECRSGEVGGSYMAVEPRPEVAQCQRCAKPFSYMRVTVHRKSCDACRDQSRRDAVRRHAAKKTQAERKDQQLRSNYNITLKQYEAMSRAQGGGCAICGGQSTQGRALAVDHDHSCCPGKRSCGGCVRGLLCSSCNSGLGSMKDDRSLFLRAAAYLDSALLAVSA